jgi:hypothetical protein
MIIVPGWIKNEVSDGIHAILGSQPNLDSPVEWLPRRCVDKCVYAPDGECEGFRFAMMMLVEENLPDRIVEVLNLKRDKK